MNILYHLTVPPSPMPGCDAVVQDIEALRERVGGQVVHLYPGRAPGTRFPRRWWGLQHLFRLRRLERQVDLHHIFNPDPFPFDVLRFLRRPIVYTAAAGAASASEADRQAVRRLARQAYKLVVPADPDRDRLRQMGVENVAVIRPGLDVSRFSYAPPPAGTPLTLLMGSAPWTREQFHSKGVDTLLEAARQRPDVRLVFLWRGLLFDEMTRRVRAAGLGDRVEVLDEQVDVNAVLSRVHASVALADSGVLIKAYPHSLLESLAAGKPVLLSRAIPMAEYVERLGCGLVVEGVDTASVLAALEALARRYTVYQQAARSAAQEFAPPTEAYLALYADALASQGGNRK